MSKLKRFVKLSDLAEIRTGFTFREKIEEVESGNAHVLQIKDIRNIATDTCSYTLLQMLYRKLIGKVKITQSCRLSLCCCPVVESILRHIIL